MLVVFAFLFVFASAPSFAVAQSNSALLTEIKQLSKQGKTVNSESFRVGSSLKQVVKKWGEPEDLSTVAANYWSKNIRFLYDGEKAKQPIYQIDDFDPSLQSITYYDAVNVFGTPLIEKEQEGNYYVTYAANKRTTITFVFQSRFTNDNPTLELYYVAAK
jgi:hypothetical protein